MSGILPVLIVICALLTLGVLLMGIAGFVKGGEFNSKYGNLFMRYRVGFQLVTILLLMLLFALAGRS